MKYFLFRLGSRFHFLTCFLLFTVAVAPAGLAQGRPVTITVSGNPEGAPLERRFVGLSYEISKLNSQGDHYYFNTNDRPLVNIFKTLGIRSLRVGANAVDNAAVPVPQEKDIDHFFNFAGEIGAKVIYSFRLKNGDASESVRLAAYIAAHHAAALDCFSIGNEPNFYVKTFRDYFAIWKPQYDAILKAVPNAKFIGPSVANAPPAKQNDYPLELAKRMTSGGHLTIASDHYYFLGRRNDLEKDPAGARAMLMSDKVHSTYETAYAHIGAKLATSGVPYRIDELNNCARGGARDSSDTYAAALWALDCTHWWAAHHILGMNYHTGEFLKPDGSYGAPYYSAFVHQADGHGLNILPQAYAYLAFEQGAHGQSLPINLQAGENFDFDAYAYRDQDGTMYVTMINKSFGSNAQSASVSVNLPSKNKTGRWQRLDLEQKENEPAARSDITFGGAPIDSQGNWLGSWSNVSSAGPDKLTLVVRPASATILRLSGSSQPLTYSGSKPDEN